MGTFHVVSNRMEMQAFPTSSQEFFEILSRRHAILLAGRPELNPGHFKTKNNRAGNTEFVDVNRVQGTLDAGFNYYCALTSPIAKAIYMMFLISEVHPFQDGNGRLARIMMNSELYDTITIRVPLFPIVSLGSVYCLKTNNMLNLLLTIIY